ncbi:MAG: hypothetical protein F6K35_25535, partial [Okeania sp. SIO2H7]|nr:hypothetical protein [Okeania sp. SIO2H7]
IYFDRDRFKIENRLLGSTTQEKQGNTKEILGVLVERRAGSKGAVSYLVRLRTTRENYNINGLDENDSFILAQEIQDWLYQIKNR